MYIFSPDKTPNMGAVHQTLSVYERELEVKPFENKSVCARVHVWICVCACQEQHWRDYLLAGFIAYRQTARPQQSQLTALICFDRGGFSAALDTHLQQEPWRWDHLESFLKRSDRQWPLLLEKGAYEVVSLDCNLWTRCHSCLSNVSFQTLNGQHSLVLNSSIRASNWVRFFFLSFCQRMKVITLQNIAFIQAFVPSILQWSALAAISST